MNDFYHLLFTIPVSIGCVVFLIQQTDFVYEYASLALSYIKIQKLRKVLNLDGYENSSSFENYIIFIASTRGIKKDLGGFTCRLVSCFICLNCFLSVFSVLVVTKSAIMIFPCFFLSVLTFYVLFRIKKSVFS